MLLVPSLRNLRSLAIAAQHQAKKIQFLHFITQAASHSKQFKLEYLQGRNEGIAIFTMARFNARNALGKLFMVEFNEALNEVQAASNVRVLILRSIVPKVFCAGADLKERLHMSEAEVASTVEELRTTFTKFEQLPMPTIAAMEGAALGGGLEIALPCDFRIAGQKAKFGFPETSLAIFPGAGGTQRLPRLIGLSRAKELIYTGRQIEADEAEALGLVDDVTDEDGSYDRAIRLAHEILPKGPIGIRMAKEAITKGIDMDRASSHAFERACYAQTTSTKDRLEGLQAFRDKRKPNYKGE
uniref:EnoylCoA hydratase/isomerase family putative n=1 Tax=Albugo laibachii Nc14 TaxID=890382 RepID=F0WI83_9STRA|nr:enoylCoA hydratase/isomerase family putative [Albugo laibachii Nc14]|eukprot:CCA20962.1 enoylCoA hydratase/isomerase family putative [Albugo laibachii Nc14]